MNDSTAYRVENSRSITQLTNIVDVKRLDNDLVALRSSNGTDCSAGCEAIMFDDGLIALEQVLNDDNLDNDISLDNILKLVSKHSMFKHDGKVHSLYL